ncbi:hypothetical protein QMA71_17805 [Pseudomonas otitidis]|uniref:hypothetical protein n=1 Tax=Metapseudomonas otitidis TaxID=319939 RepID=UPI0024AE5967|nr:hypothetical protein [Pseudomonas otitidis]MDI6527394.1 hypothetical protein [Pseudomonas otitidis]
MPPVNKEVKEKAEPEETIFSISYDADDSELADHEINAKHLGESILSMHQLVEETARVISSGSAKVELKVTTPAKKGSLTVVFALLADPAVALKILGTLGFASHAYFANRAALVELIKKIGNRKIRSISIEGDNPDATIHTDDGIITADKHVAQLASSKKARESLHKIVQAPLDGKKDAVFKVLNNSNVEIWKAKEEEIPIYSPLPNGTLEDVSTKIEKINISFSQVNFDSSNGWKIRNKDGLEFPVFMKDYAFLEKVSQNEQAFKKDDLYEIELETTTTSRPTRSTIDRVVLKVTRHWAAGERRQV